MEGFEAVHQVRVNGITLRYAAAGRGKPVVLLHGNGEDHNLFPVTAEQLTQAGYRVLAPDSRGHGANPPLEEYHYADMAEDIYCFIRKLGLRKPALYGHSDGGIIGLMLELAHPGTLGLLAISGTNLSPEGLYEEFQEEAAEQYAQDPQPLLRLMLTEPNIDPATLESIRIPVLVTAGEFDLIRREETAEIVRRLPRAQEFIVPDESHGSYIEDSPIMGELLLEFLAQHRREWRGR